jgi:nitronate monooxygenase
MKVALPSLKIGDLIARLPIIQGRMGVGISLSGLAAAVANEGAIGVISSVGIGALYAHADTNYQEENIIALKAEIHKARQKSSGILGVNIMLALTDFDNLIKVAFDENIDIVFLGAGLLLKVPSTMTLAYLQQTKTKIGVIVSSARAAKLIITHWAKHFDRIPDLVVVEGPKAGGHLGFKPEQIFNPDFALEKIIPQVIETVSELETLYDTSIPIVAAGGIFNGKDIHRFMNMGVSGVQMGTRFVATHECDADAAFKQSYVDCTQEDIVIINSPVGLPGRAIQNSFLKAVAQGAKIPYSCPWKCLKTCDYHHSPYCIARALVNAQHGKLKEGFAFAGANAFMVKQITTVKELIHNLLQEYNQAVAEA